MAAILSQPQCVNMNAQQQQQQQQIKHIKTVDILQTTISLKFIPKAPVDNK